MLKQTGCQKTDKAAHLNKTRGAMSTGVSFCGCKPKSGCVSMCVCVCMCIWGNIKHASFSNKLQPTQRFNQCY